MALKPVLCNKILHLRNSIGFACRMFSEEIKDEKSTHTITVKSEPNLDNIKGLSEKVVHKVPEPLGPGASSTGDYKVPEYFCYDTDSFFQAELELEKYRLPQPSSLGSRP